MININKKIFYNNQASSRYFWKKKYSYYYSQLEKYFSFYVLPDSKILEVGCGTGELLNYLKPSKGIGVDISPNMIDIAKKKFPNIEFYCMNANSINFDATFDYIIISDLIRDLDDVYIFFNNLKK